jgi:teichuronic acid biosynthesis glycosyltransferase TuaH
VRRALDASALRRVRAHLRAAGIDVRDCVCVISNVYAIHVAAALGARAIVYDCNDAHAEFPGMPVWTRDYQTETLRRADTVIVSSRGLIPMAERARGSLEGVHLVGNGVDFALFAVASAEAAAAAPGPIRVGYVGAVAPWFDFDLVTAMARSRPDWHFEIVGPVLGGVEHALEELAAHPNVAVSGPVPHAEVPGVLARYTVGMIPFKKNALTAGVNPNKLYEYLAAGLPTVATSFSPDVAAEPGVIALADDAPAFEAACGLLGAARSDPGRLQTMRARAAEIARAHDWNTIAGVFWSHVVNARRSS